VVHAAPYNAAVHRNRSALLLAVLAGWAVLGAARHWRQATTSPRAPAWSEALAPLATAPLPAGARVALAAPDPGGGREALKPLLMEAAWQRPDLRWAFLDAWPAGATPERLVAVGAVVPPAAWREVWREGVVTVYEARGG